MPTGQQSLQQTRIVDPILTTIAQGYSGNNKLIGQYISPLVEVLLMGGQVVKFGKEAYKLFNTRRAPGGTSKRVTWGYSADPYKLENHGLEHTQPLQLMEQAELALSINWGMRSMNYLMSLITLSLEADIADTVLNPTNYASTHKVTLSGTDKLSDPACNPTKLKNDWSEVVRASIGIEPNVMMIPSKAFLKLDELPVIRERLKYTGRDSITAEMLAELWGLEKVLIGKAVMLDEATNTFKDIWGDSIWLGYVNPQALVSGKISYSPSPNISMEEPSSFYTYCLKGHPFAEPSYDERPTKSRIWPVVYDYKVLATGESSGFLAQSVI